jgi:Contractile injection system tube protein/LysM domain
MALQKAILRSVSHDPARSSGNIPAEGVTVLFNPTEYEITRNVNYAEIAVPGLQVPLLQFVRGDSQVLSVELFLDKTTTRESVAADLAALRGFVTIDSDLHAPPVCQFQWGDITFEGVVASFREKFTLFDDSGHILRARVTLSVKSYTPAAVQYREQNLQSPDRTKSRVVHEGDRLEAIAAEEYGDPTQWRVIARANGITRPRLLRLGQVLTIPPL